MKLQRMEFIKTGAYLQMKCQMCNKQIKKESYVKCRVLCPLCFEKEKQRTSGGLSTFKRVKKFWGMWR